MDRNSIIGWTLLILMLVGYMIYNENQNLQYQRQKAIQDSIAQASRPHPASAPSRNGPDTAGLAAATRMRDSAETAGRLGNFAAAAQGEPQSSTLENQLLRIDFTNQGGRPTSILLKKFKTFEGKPLLLMHGAYENLSLDFYTSSGQLIQTGDLYFKPGPVQSHPDSSESVSYRLDAGGAGQYLEYIYTIHPGSYMVDFDIRMNGMDQVVRNDSNSVTMHWQGQGDHQENDVKRERTLTQIYYLNTRQQSDFFYLYKTNQKTLSEPLQWISFKQEFFNITFIPEKPFTSATINGSIPDSGDVVSRASFALGIPFDHTAQFDYPSRLFLGPNDYNILKSYNLGLQNLIQLGYGIFAFVKYINIGFIIPLFTFFSRFVHNFGVIIIIMTLFIRIILSPLTYKSYVSAAKMKVLKPELDELHKKFPDQQKFGVEQMKLFRTAGVSPLGGCLPTLLQLPILYAMYDFFPSSIELRQQSFLWCKDLSTYDSIWTFPNHFSIPAYGDHISLFTILMTATSIFLALYNKNMTDQSNPMLKWMPYIFPVILLGVFNNLAAALTFYYFLSNLISIGLQWVIQTYIIDEKKIHKQIQENKKKPVKKSKWAERLEQAQKMQQASSQQKIQPRKGK
ncbi:MAG TPA: membrane protein insertase YidC [Chitinophagaceae bacterium]|nr:membrane protein insertase YidC [Chitinophagaceae bacterium]